MKEPENCADVKKAYHAFLARSNMLDLIDIYGKCYGLGLLAEDESISPVSIMFVWPLVLFWHIFGSGCGFMTFKIMHRSSGLFTTWGKNLSLNY